MEQRYNLTITDLGKPIISLKNISAVLKLEIDAAKKLLDFIVENLPCPLVAGVEKKIADHIIKYLDEAGVSTELVESEFKHPMVIYPVISKKWKRSIIFGFKEEI